MKILIVKKEGLRPFVEEQTKALSSLGVECVFHLIIGNGIWSYIRDIHRLFRDIQQVQPDIIHAHYGLSGFYACCVIWLMRMHRRIPLVITYHGSDINNPRIRKISQRAIWKADYNIFVSPKLAEKVLVHENYQVIPCGIDWQDWKYVDKQEARRLMGLDEKKKIVLFSSNFHSPIKNPSLAKESVQHAQELLREEIQLIELTKYTRAQVNLLMHAADVCLMTSFTEGSPQFIKEAMACSCPIVTTRVGDTEYVIGDTKGCFFTDYSEDNCAEQIMKALQYAEQFVRTDGKVRIKELGYGNDVVAKKIKDIYLYLTQKR